MEPKDKNEHALVPFVNIIAPGHHHHYHELWPI